MTHLLKLFLKYIMEQIFCDLKNRFLHTMRYNTAYCNIVRKCFVNKKIFNLLNTYPISFSISMRFIINVRKRK